MRKVLIALLFAGAGTVAMISTAAAGTANATDITFHNIATVPIPGAMEPCTNGPGDATVDFTAVFHITIIDPGIEVVASTLTGTFVFVPSGASQPTFSGRFVSSFQIQSTPPGQQFNTTNEFLVVGTGSDGGPMSFHEIAHVTRTPAGDIAVSFDTPTCATP